MTAAATVVGESSSFIMNCQVGEGGAQRLLPRGRHVGAAGEEEGGEGGERAQCLQAFARNVGEVGEVELGECREAADCKLIALGD
jgi:hypothetical protein